jgi:CPA1 family monovalent cation:H+ antiporter
MVAGLVIGNASQFLPLPERKRSEVVTFWEALAFLVNSIVFILIGIHRGHLGNLAWYAVAICALVVIAGRAVAVYPCCALYARSRLRLPWAYQHVLVWGGLRGAVALTLALGLPDTLPHADQIRLLTFAVVCGRRATGNRFDG